MTFRRVGRRRRRRILNVLYLVTVNVMLIAVRYILVPSSRHYILRHATAQTVLSNNQGGSITSASSVSSPVFESSTPYDHRNNYPLRQFQSRDHFLYFHRTATSAGLNNQLQCIHLAANLALKYNRTLLLSKKVFQGDIRFYKTLDFDDVFDDDLSQFPIRVSILNDSGTSSGKVHQAFTDYTSPYYNCIANQIEKFHHPDDTIQTSPLGYEMEHAVKTATDNYNNKTLAWTRKCVSFHCGWAQLHLSAPPSRFPYIDNNLLPLNQAYMQIADRILSTMTLDRRSKDGVHKNRAQPNNNNALAIHIRGGDNPGHPVLNCSETKSHPYLVVNKYPSEGRRWGVFCSRTNNSSTATASTKEDKFNILSWERYLQHMVACDGEIPICIDDYDSIYIATNDERYRKSSLAAMMEKIFNSTTMTTKIFYLHDFDFVDDELKRHFIMPYKNNDKPSYTQASKKKTKPIRLHPLHYFLLEEAILTSSRTFQASVPSSVSDVVYHYRQHDMQSINEVEMYDMWNAMTIELLKASSETTPRRKVWTN